MVFIRHDFLSLNLRRSLSSLTTITMDGGSAAASIISSPDRSRFRSELCAKFKIRATGLYCESDQKRACALGRPSTLNTAHREARRSKAQNTRSNPQNIPFDANIAAGRAWRRRLGFWWARANSSPRGDYNRVRSGDEAALAMNNGGGGYNP
jgi:hypothetical protein